VSEESKTPDLVALGLQAYEALSCGDFDAAMSLFAADAVYDGSDGGIGTFEGVEAIRGFIEDWFRSWEEYRYEAEETLDLGHGVVVFVLREGGRLIGGDGRVEQRAAHVTTWADGLMERVAAFSDLDEARATAERLAEERGSAVSQENVEVVRRAIEAFNRRDFDVALQDAAPDATFDMSRSQGPDAGVYVGHDAVRRLWTDITEPFERSTMVPHEFIPHGEHVVVPMTSRMTGRGGIEVEAKSATVATLRDGCMVWWTMYQDRAEALKAVGLSE
jgi:ketosteroid isomerase-like protein